MKFPFSRHKCLARAWGCRWVRKRVQGQGPGWTHGRMAVWGAGHVPMLHLEGQCLGGWWTCLPRGPAPGAGAVVTSWVSGAPRPRGAPHSEYPFLLLPLLTQAVPSAAQTPAEVPASPMGMGRGEGAGSLLWELAWLPSAHLQGGPWGEPLSCPIHFIFRKSQRKPVRNRLSSQGPWSPQNPGRRHLGPGSIGFPPAQGVPGF